MEWDDGEVRFILGCLGCGCLVATALLLGAAYGAWLLISNLF